MNLDELVSKYIDSAEHVLGRIEIVKETRALRAERVRKIFETAKDYLEDAKYYKDKDKLEVSLTSVAYCEGLLDALKLLGVVKFEWPTKKKKER
jgi:hypothetical protein